MQDIETIQGFFCHYHLKQKSSMHFLNGGRIYIKPANIYASTGEQLADCIIQLTEFNQVKKIFKLNFFAEVASAEAYIHLKNSILKQIAKEFSRPLICGLIAQAPLNCRILAEAFYYDEQLWQQELIQEESFSAVHFKRNDTRVLTGQIQSSSLAVCRRNAEEVFSLMGRLLEKTQFPVSSVIRQWNYIENILGYENGLQNYQEFNNVRSAFYADHFSKNGYPAATGIGMNRGGIMLQFVALLSGEAVSLPLDNPEQRSAHTYSNGVLIGKNNSLKTTPKFERARYLELFGNKQVFISGTASICGENTVGVGDAELQTEITIQNIKRLYSEDVLKAVAGNFFRPQYGHARVYMKNSEDFYVIRKVVKKHYGNLPVVYLVADICREELLVEIEGKVILE
jgi:enamine deaminase RidA (YjgF/YER057c/UK114 family)